MMCITLAAASLNSVFFFFNDTATTEIYTTHNTLSLHDALPICPPPSTPCGYACPGCARVDRSEEHTSELQSLCVISYAVFCLKKKKKIVTNSHYPFYHIKLVARKSNNQQ